VIQGPSGSMLGAVNGTLTAPLPVWLNEAPPPSEPLLAGATPRGAYYNAGAECTTFAPQGAPFALALPVPEDADTSKLGVAVLSPARYLINARRDGVVWELASGVYDPDSRLYLIPRAALLSEGSTFVLVEHPDVRPMTARRSKLRGEAVAPPAFVVRCSAMAANCGPQQEQAVLDGLVQAYGVYQSQGFLPPALVSYDLYRDVDGSFKTAAGRYTETLIRARTDPVCPKNDSVLAFYDSVEAMMTVCLPSSENPPDDALRGGIRHELFHAVQWAYPKISQGSSDDWVVEGTATAAVAFDTEMHRTSVFNYPLREVDGPMESGLIDSDTWTKESFYPYETQDFWVYLLLSGGRNANLGTLDSFFKLGATTSSVANRLANDNNSLLLFRSLGEEYWSWVKNQVMEKTVPLESIPPPGNSLASPCQLEYALLGKQETDAADISWPASHEAVVGLMHLQAKLVKIELTEPASFLTVSAENAGAPGGLSYKVYLKGETDCANPAVVPENSRRFNSLPKGAVIYVVLANVESEGVVPPFYRVLVTSPR